MIARRRRKERAVSDSRRADRRVAPQRTRVAVVLAIILVIVPVVLLGLYPTRPYLAQRTVTRQAERELAEIERDNDALEARVERLQTSEEIERIARRDHGLVKLGEEAYAVLPAQSPPVELPEVWPFVGADDLLNG